MRNVGGASAYNISQLDEVNAAVPKIGWRKGMYTISSIMTSCVSIPSRIHRFLKGFEENAE